MSKPAGRISKRRQAMARIRLAREADAASIAAIYAPFVERTATTFETVPPGENDMARRIAETTVSYPWLVCEVADRVVGYAYATEHRVRRAYRWSVDAAVYVDSDYHRRGIGTGLYTSLFSILRAQGFVNAYAGITLPNDGSVALHEALGFTPVGVYARVGYKHGEWRDVGWWHLALLPHTASPPEPRDFPTLFDDPGWERIVRSGEGRIDSAPTHSPKGTP